MSQIIVIEKNSRGKIWGMGGPQGFPPMTSSKPHGREVSPGAETEAGQWLG